MTPHGGKGDGEKGWDKRTGIETGSTQTIGSVQKNVTKEAMALIQKSFSLFFGGLEKCNSRGTRRRMEGDIVRGWRRVRSFW